MMRAALLLMLLLAGSAAGQTATYRGRVYTPQSFPRATWCSCGMCQVIRAQWAQSVQPVQVKVEEPSPVRQRTDSPRGRVVYRQVTRYRTTQRKMCVGGVCRIVTVQEPYTTWEPVPEPEPTVAPEEPEPPAKPVALSGATAPRLSQGESAEDFVPTPAEVVRAMIEQLDPQPGERFVDLGCGDGRLVIEAAKRGAEALGVEIVPRIAELARKKIAEAGVSASVQIGDALRFDGSADCVALYLYPDQLAEIVDKLTPGTRVASYAHELPGLDNQRHEVGGQVFYTATVPLLSRSPLGD